MTTEMALGVTEQNCGFQEPVTRCVIPCGADEVCAWQQRRGQASPQKQGQETQGQGKSKKQKLAEVDDMPPKPWKPLNPAEIAEGQRSVNAISIHAPHQITNYNIQKTSNPINPPELSSQVVLCGSLLHSKFLVIEWQ